MENKSKYIELVEISKRNLKSKRIKPKSKSSTRSGIYKNLWRNRTGGRKNSRKRISRRQIKTNKKRKLRHGGYIDDLTSEDFNANLAYDQKQRGGQKICGDPNFSIYNTNQLKLFPYKP